MTHKENITAILECCFAGFKEEIIDSACNRILEQESFEDAISRKALTEWLESIQPADGKELGVLFDVREHVKKMQPVTPTKEHGEWIPLARSCPKQRVNI